MRIFLGLLAAATIATPLLAHDFWLQPEPFTLTAPGRTAVMVYVGHGADRDRWRQPIERVVSFRSIGPDGTVDRKPVLTLGGPRVDADVPLTRRGGYVLALHSTPALSELPADKFDAYVAEEGITPIAALRARSTMPRAVGREAYSRRAKAIVQVGPVDAASVARVTQPIGLTLELVPERHPAQVKANGSIPVCVYYEGKPLAGALVKLTDLGADAKPVAMMRTGMDGRASFTLPRRAKWQLNVIWAAPANNNPVADYDTVFSSLTFAN